MPDHAAHAQHWVASAGADPVSFFMPHGHCYLWQPGLLLLQVSTNALIGGAYVAIAATLAYMVYRIGDLPFRAMYIAFGLFIVSCGVTHFMDVWVIWHPDYWFDGGVRAVTAVASIGTAITLPPLVPKALAIARGAQAAHQRGVALEHMVSELGTMYERSRELEQLKTNFFANVSHELRTPLALVLGPVERLLNDEHLSPAQRSDLEVVQKNARLLLRHVNDLLDVARIEAGKSRVEYAPTDLAELTRRVAGLFESAAAERSIAFEVAAPGELQAEADTEKIERVLINLLSNAFKFTPKGGKVRVSLAAREGEATIEVADSGPGIPAADREVVFERFRQLDGSSTRLHGGTGLGLTISKDFVEEHAGRLWAADAPEGGALLVVELPLRAPSGVEVAATPPEPAADGVEAAAAELAASAGSDRPSLPETEPPPAGERPLVLVVEDNPDMNRFVCRTLEPAHRCLSAFDGQEGLELALKVEPDLILTDVMMPRMSGDQLVHELRRRQRFDPVPIVLLTAKASDELRVRLLERGAQDYVMKPFSPQELLVRVRNLVASKRARDILQQELEHQVRDLETLAHEVSHRKRALELALDTARVARDEAERANQLKSNFLRLLSHELRTPLTVVQLQIALLVEQLGPELTEVHRKLLDRMESSNKRLIHLIEALLEQARISGGSVAVEPEPVDLGALGREVVEQSAPDAERKGLRVELRVADVPLLSSDRRLLRLVLTNLVGNAIKFTQQGWVRVEIDHAGGCFRLAVRDTGPGIAPEHRAEIFEPFHHLEPLQHKHTPGIGLGLALVRELVSGLGGEVELESELDRGTTFTVVLPATGLREAC